MKEKPTWQEITAEAERFSVSRGINVIDSIRCFEQCAKFIAKYKNDMKENQNGCDCNCNCSTTQNECECVVNGTTQNGCECNCNGSK